MTGKTTFIDYIVKDASDMALRLTVGGVPVGELDVPGLRAAIWILNGMLTDERRKWAEERATMVKIRAAVKPWG